MYILYYMNYTIIIHIIYTCLFLCLYLSYSSLSISPSFPPSLSILHILTAISSYTISPPFSSPLFLVPSNFSSFYCLISLFSLYFSLPFLSYPLSISFSFFLLLLLIFCSSIVPPVFHLEESNSNNYLN